MAINAAMQWWIRTGGSNNNGAGYDSTVASAGTNYADQDTAQLALTDIVANGTTTLTSVTGGFTTAMIGNVIKLRSFSSGGATGYRVITARTDTNTITVDATVTTGTGGSGNVGGASATLLNFTNGGTAGTPAVTSPLAAGHTLNLQGAGTDDPSSADYTNTGYMQFASGSSGSGIIRLIGYNGRPYISANGLTIYNVTAWKIQNVKFKITGTSSGSADLGILNGSTPLDLDNVYVDMNGQDIAGLKGAGHVVNSKFINSGSTTAGTYAAILPGQWGARIYGCTIDKWRGYGIEFDSVMQSAQFCTITNCKKTGVGAINVSASTFDYRSAIINCTIDGNAADGIKFSNIGLADCLIRNNIITTNGGYGINCSTGTTAFNDRAFTITPDYNNFGTGATANTSGARNALSAGTHDLALDPQFTNAAAGDYSVGTNMKAAASPGVFPGGLSTGYLDIGAVQRQEPAASSGGVTVPTAVFGSSMMVGA